MTSSREALLFQKEVESRVWFLCGFVVKTCGVWWVPFWWFNEWFLEFVGTGVFFEGLRSGFIALILKCTTIHRGSCFSRQRCSRRGGGHRGGRLVSVSCDM